jgi:hypothetical protein
MAGKPMNATLNEFTRVERNSARQLARMIVQKACVRRDLYMLYYFSQDLPLRAIIDRLPTLDEKQLAMVDSLIASFQGCGEPAPLTQ